MNRRTDNEFHVKPEPPRGKQSRQGEQFASKVLREASRIGPMPSRGASTRPRPTLARLGRGAGAAAFAGDRLGPDARRVVIKSRIVNLKRVTPQAVDAHLRYITRDGISRDGQPAQPYGPETDAADWHEFAAKGRKDRHQFRFIVAPEDGVDLQDLRDFTRELMSTMQKDLGTRLEWIAVDHWDTDNPHTHVVLRGRAGRDNLIIARHYLTDGMRLRACEIATDWLGIRTELEMQRSLQQEVRQERWTGLDRQLQHLAQATGSIDLARPGADVEALRHRNLLLGRLQVLERFGLAREQSKGVWELSAEAEATLKALGERGDIIKAMHRALRGEQRELVLFDADARTSPSVIGRIAGCGYSDELEERAYIIVDGINGKAHHVPVGTRDLSTFPIGGIVEVKPTPVRAADRNIAALSQNGVYVVAEHRQVLRTQRDPANDPNEIVEAHIRRLEALRRAGIVQREAEGVWRIPPDLVARGHAYDRQRSGGVDIHLLSHLPIDRQVTTMGATWLDQRLVSGTPTPNAGFGASVNAALHKRVDFLIEQGFAKRKGERAMTRTDLLSALRQRELDGIAKSIANETGMAHRPLVDGERTTGIYRRMVVAASGRFAMLDDGLGFSLVPWRPVLEQRIGQQLSATMHGDHVTWSFGRHRGLSR